MTKLLIANDDPLTLAGIQALLAGSDFVVVGAVSNGRLALEELASKRPDLGPGLRDAGAQRHGCVADLAGPG